MSNNTHNIIYNDRTGGLVPQGSNYFTTDQETGKPVWFSPGTPLNPIAQEVAGRSFDFPTTFNTNYRPKFDIKDGLTFEELRALSKFGLIPLIIESVKDRLVSSEWEIIDNSKNKSLGRIQKKAIKFLESPSEEYDEWGTWIGAIVYDMLILDSIALYPTIDSKGSLCCLDVIDAATIKRLIDQDGRTPAPPYPAYQQILKGVPAVDYTKDELIYASMNRKSCSVYGYSPLEQASDYINLHMSRFMQQYGVLNQGNIPLVFATAPNKSNAEQIRELQNVFDSYYLNNSVNKSMIKWFPDGCEIKTMPFPEVYQKDGLDEWITRVLCYAFSVTATVLLQDNNRATAKVSAAVTLEEGDLPKKCFIEKLITNKILKRFFSPDLQFKFKTMESVDPVTQSQVNSVYLMNGVKTVNEVRSELGLESLDDLMLTSMREKEDTPKKAQETIPGSTMYSALHLPEPDDKFGVGSHE